jgi:hypothetical protein
MLRLAALVSVVVTGALLVTRCDYVHGPFLGRVDQPVVLTGADLPEAIGLDPARATLWRWQDGWVQIPVQVDQRHVVPFGSQPPDNTTPGTTGTVYGYGSGGPTALQYSDPDTFVGADPDPGFDADDELVFMARDAGGPAPPGAERPPGTVAGTGRRIELTEPTDGDTGDVYLYYGTVGADPSAGRDYVHYDFVLDSGDYTSTYRRADGPNPEHSAVTTYAYELSMVDRWVTTDLTIAKGGVDVLDGFKARFSFSTCGRSNATFADAEGAFVANVDGPVRAVRSYVGANSGPLTQETWLFYSDRIEQVTDLRVHAIPGVMSFVDLSSAADGMLYSNSEMGGTTVQVDGDPVGDSVPSTLPTWEYLHGPQGGLTIAHETTSTSPLPATLEWVDDATPPYTECWGDGEYHGVAAHTIPTGIPNTDPRTVPFEELRSRRVVGVWGPEVGQSSWAPLWASQSLVDVVVSVAPA